MPVLLACAFRPFFLLAAACAAVTVLAWVGLLFGGWPLPVGWPPAAWHSHEMLYGVVPAAVAGFLLTAITNWTGAAPLRGMPLLALILIWLAGRLALWLSGLLPGALVAALDLAFLPLLTGYTAAVLLRYRNYRNLVLVAALALLLLGNLLMHAGAAGGDAARLRAGELLGFDGVVLLMVVIAGRITPAFSRNWLRARGGDPARVRQSALLDNLSLGAVALLAAADLAAGGSGPWVAAAALAAALLNGWRLLRWAGWKTLPEPLLWILHLACLWLVAALALRVPAALDGGAGDTLWQHALGAGAIGVLLLGVMTRVAVGHTGRPLALVRHALWIYVAINAAALLRVLSALGVVEHQAGVTAAAVGWILAFGLYALLYWPILAAPRADGRPG